MGHGRALRKPGSHSKRNEREVKEPWWLAGVGGRAWPDGCGRTAVSFTYDHMRLQQAGSPCRTTHIPWSLTHDHVGLHSLAHGCEGLDVRCMHGKKQVMNLQGIVPCQGRTSRMDRRKQAQGAHAQLALGPDPTEQTAGSARPVPPLPQHPPNSTVTVSWCLAKWPCSSAAAGGTAMGLGVWGELTSGGSAGADFACVTLPLTGGLAWLEPGPCPCAPVLWAALRRSRARDLRWDAALGRPPPGAPVPEVPERLNTPGFPPTAPLDPTWPELGAPLAPLVFKSLIQALELSSLHRRASPAPLPLLANRVGEGAPSWPLLAAAEPGPAACEPALAEALEPVAMAGAEAGLGGNPWVEPAGTSPDDPGRSEDRWDRVVPVGSCRGAPSPALLCCSPWPDPIWFRLLPADSTGVRPEPDAWPGVGLELAPCSADAAMTCREQRMSRKETVEARDKQQR